MLLGKAVIIIAIIIVIAWMLGGVMRDRTKR